MDYHYQTMGRILSHLVQRGLARVDFAAADAMEIMTERHGDEEEVLSTFADVLHWMHDEGLIRVANIQEYDGGYDFMGVQLTSKGIAVLRAKPDDAELGESVEKTVTEAGTGELDASLFTKIGSCVGGFAGGFTKAVGGG